MQIDRLWINARLATMARDRPGLGIDRTRRRRHARGRITYVGDARLCPPGSTRGKRRSARAAGHARADRLPHASRLRRRPRGRMGDAPARRDLRGDRARRRRHPLDREGDARGERGRACRGRAAAPRRADRRRRDDDRDQVRLRARSRRTKRRCCAPRRGSARARRERWRAPSSARMRCRRKPAATSRRYIDQVCDEQLPLVAEEGLADAVDGFCERIAFSAGEMARVFDAARRRMACR